MVGQTGQHILQKGEVHLLPHDLGILLDLAGVHVDGLLQLSHERVVGSTLGVIGDLGQHLDPLFEILDAIELLSQLGQEVTMLVIMRETDAVSPPGRHLHLHRREAVP